MSKEVEMSGTEDSGNVVNLIVGMNQRIEELVAENQSLKLLVAKIQIGNFDHEADELVKTKVEKRNRKESGGLTQALESLKDLQLQVSEDMRVVGMQVTVQSSIQHGIPEYKKYVRYDDPVAHVMLYKDKMKGFTTEDKSLIMHFGHSLDDEALKWYTRQDIDKMRTWEELALMFIHHFKLRIFLSGLRKLDEEDFDKYARRWKAQALQLIPSLTELEMVDLFLQAQSNQLDHRLLGAYNDSFGEAVAITKTVDEQSKGKKVLNPSVSAHIRRTLRAQAYAAPKTPAPPAQHYLPQNNPPQNNHPNQLPYQPLLPPYQVPLPMPYQPQRNPPYNAPQPYSTPPTLPYFTSPAYPLYQTLPQNHPPTNHPPAQPRYQNRPRFTAGKKRQENFTPISESYASLLKRLIASSLLSPVAKKMPNPVPENFDYSKSCAFHSGTQGHDTEECNHLKSVVQKLIDEKKIVVESNYKIIIKSCPK